VDCQKPTRKTNGHGHGRKPRDHGLWFHGTVGETVISELPSARDQSAIVSATFC
jgi:hypothetical protein